MDASVSIFGLGYVGSVMAACLAHKGFRVVGVDVNPEKVSALQSGRSPIVEARMEELVTVGRRECLLHATTDPRAAVSETDISFVCVGTPSSPGGKPDLSHILHVSREIGEGMRHKGSRHLVAIRSTVLPGTTETVVIPSLEAAGGKRAGAEFAVCYNPEFMREGNAVADFFDPPFTVLGCQSPNDLTPLRKIYSWAPGRKFETTLRVAEMVKYISNTYHALKVDFANEMAALCGRLSVDAQAVSEIFLSDTKLNISPAYLTPGFAFGGSCLPKDVRALADRARDLDLKLPLLEAVLPSNTEHVERALALVLRTGKKSIGVLGVSFKRGTDDVRESPSIALVQKLINSGCQVRLWDPDVAPDRITGSNRQFVEGVIPQFGSLLSSNLEDVVQASEVVVIGTGSVEKSRLARLLAPGQILIDMIRPGAASPVDGPVK